MTRLLLALDERLDVPIHRIAGAQVRMWEMGRALAAAGCAVTIGQPGGTTTVHEAIEIASFDRLAGTFDAVIAAPRTWRRHHRRWQARAFVADGVEAPFASFLAHASAHRARGGVTDAWYRGVVIDYLEALAAADAVICGNPRQRISYQTLLCAIGAEGPARSREADLLVVHSGAPRDTVPAPTRPDLLELSAHGPVVLWAGGVYPWFDLETFLRAIPAIAASVPDAQFAFAGLTGVGEESRQWTSDRVRAHGPLAGISGRLHFLDWTPYPERGQLYRCARLVVSTHDPGFETTLSMRARLVECTWARTPFVGTEGDWLTDTLAAAGGAVAVAAGDAGAVASGVTRLLTDDAARERCRSALDQAATTWLSWDTQVQPLVAWLHAGHASRAGLARAHAGAAIRSRHRQQADLWAARLTDWVRRHV